MAWDNGKMDKFDLLHSNGTKGASAPYTNNSLTQLYQSNIPDYWTYAHNRVKEGAHRNGTEIGIADQEPYYGCLLT
jgi:hypothetical protein